MDSIFRPRVVNPDKNPADLSLVEAKDALNMEIGPSSPTGGPSVRKTLGNVFLENPLLPIGRNKALAWCFDQAAMILYWINWNENPDNQAIYSYSETDGFALILQRNLLMTENSKPTIAFGNGYLTWTDFNIPEPRQYNLSGTYATPIQEWELYQIQHVPLVPLLVDADVTAVAEYQPKPVPDTPNTGYQFAYNYEYQRSVEGRMSEPTQVYWNETLTLTIPDSEIYGYLQKNSAYNPYVVAIRFYYRQGNEGDWVYFRRLKNEGLGPSDYAITIDPITAITAIGTPSRAALLAADGIAPYVDDLIFANNRLVHGKIKTGYDAVLPEATAEIAYDNTTTMEDRNWRTFLPFFSSYDLALAFYSKEGRFIGTSSIGTFVAGNRQSVWARRCIDIETPHPGINWDTIPWNQVVDYYYDTPGPITQTYPFSRADINFAQTITITPTGTLPDVVDSVKLITKNHITASSFLRTQTRSYWVYKNITGGLVLVGSTADGEIIGAGTSDQLTFYGIGFSFNSGEPINFSAEQNYHVRILGHLTATELIVENAGLNLGFVNKEFKITDILGTVLVSKQEWNSLPFQLPNNMVEYTEQSTYKRYLQWILDTVLYSKNIELPTTWNVVPDVQWDKNDWLALTPKKYFGDCYITGDEKQLNTENTQVFDGSSVANYLYATTLPWEGFFSSMNLNGIFQENWASDIGSATVLDEDPRRRELIQALRHSDPFIANTGINLMFTFDPLNERQVANQLGALTKMVVLSVNNQSGANLYAICEAGVEMIFLGKTQQTGTDGNSVMSLSTDVFGSTNVLQIAYGAKEKRQVTQTNVGLAWFWDETNAALVQVSNNGLDPVSVQRNFQSQAMQVGPDAIIGYNPLWKQVVVSSYGVGLAYNFRTDIYPGRRTFNQAPYPELFAWMASGRNQQSMYGFYEGNLYRFNEGASLAGVDFPCSITFVLNEALNVLKKAKAIEILSPNQTPMNVLLTTDTGLITSLNKDEFELREGNLFASFKQAENTTGGKWDGQDIHGYLMEIQLSDEGKTNNQITFVKIRTSEAQTNQK